MRRIQLVALVGLLGWAALTGVALSTFVFRPEGTRGAAGVPGPPGDHGVVGPTGSPGLAGAKGKTGDQGPRGLRPPFMSYVEYARITFGTKTDVPESFKRDLYRLAKACHESGNPNGYACMTYGVY